MSKVSMVKKVTKKYKSYNISMHIVVMYLYHIGQSVKKWTKSNLWKTAFQKFEVIRSADQLKFLSRPYHFRFCKACLRQILLGPFLNSFPHICLLTLSC